MVYYTDATDKRFQKYPKICSFFLAALFSPILSGKINTKQQIWHKSVNLTVFLSRLTAWHNY
jgi:hypothetical protein